MLDKLKKKWNVTGVQLILILCTFAFGGSLCGKAGEYILRFTSLEKWSFWYIIIYIPLISILWPFCVLLISLFFGQFRFFKNYLARVARRMKLMK